MCMMFSDMYSLDWIIAAELIVLKNQLIQLMGNIEKLQFNQVV